MLACLTSTFAAAAFYGSHPNDRYQHRFLLFAIGLATILSSASIHNMRSWLPSAITAALLLSAFTHHAFPSLRAETVEEVGEVECKDDDLNAKRNNLR